MAANKTNYTLASLNFKKLTAVQDGCGKKHYQDNNKKSLLQAALLSTQRHLMLYTGMLVNAAKCTTANEWCSA